MPSTWTVRRASLTDATGVAVVHVEAWREAYAGIVPQQVLDSLSIDQRRALWQRLLGPESATAAAGTSVWVAEDSGAIVGFSNSVPARDADATGLGELGAIYVRASHWGRGVGRALHDEAVGTLRGNGFPAALLWVLAENPRARRFYERQGWRTDGKAKREPVRGAELDHVRYRIDLAATPAADAGSNG